MKTLSRLIFIYVYKLSMNNTKEPEKYTISSLYPKLYDFEKYATLCIGSTKFSNFIQNYYIKIAFLGFRLNMETA